MYLLGLHQGRYKAASLLYHAITAHLKAIMIHLSNNFIYQSINCFLFVQDLIKCVMSGSDTTVCCCFFFVFFYYLGFTAHRHLTGYTAPNTKKLNVNKE